MSEWVVLGIVCLMMVVILVFPFRQHLLMTSFLGLGMAVFLIGGYAWMGNGAARYVNHTEQLHLAKAKEKLAAFKNTDAVVRVLKAKLDHHPHSAKGWYLLGRIYASQGQWRDAETAFAQAHRLAPEQEDFWTQYVVSLCKGTPRDMSEKNRALFKEILLAYPSQADALMFLAMDAYLSHHPANAMAYWTRLLRLMPSDSEDAKMVREMMAKVEG